MRGSRNCRVLIAVALLLAVTGCLRRERLPPRSWSQFGTARDVESLIEGSYSCTGDIVDSRTGFRQKSSAADFLIGGKEPLSCEHIEILRPAPDEITIRFMVDEKEIARKSYGKKREYDVDQSWILLQGFEEFDKEYIVRKHEVQTPRLTIDSENNLIVKQTIKFSGTMLIVVPFGMAGTEWGRFKRLR